MTDQIQDQNALLAAMQGLLKQTQAPVAAGGWGQVSQTAPGIQGVLVPMKVSTPAGEMRVYLALGPEAATPDGLMQALQALQAQGYPLDTWQPRDSGGWNRGGNSGGGGWNGGRSSGGYGGGRRW